jgi:hypothetical protein
MYADLTENVLRYGRRLVSFTTRKIRKLMTQCDYLIIEEIG